MAELNAEVLIIGAGAAGLAAAAELARSRRSVVVLEARDRIGGRCYTRQEPGLPIPVELGAEFIHGRSPPIFALLKKAGIAAKGTGQFSILVGEQHAELRLDKFYQPEDNPKLIEEVIHAAQQLNGNA